MHSEQTTECPHRHLVEQIGKDYQDPDVFMLYDLVERFQRSDVQNCLDGRIPENRKLPIYISGRLHGIFIEVQTKTADQSDLVPTRKKHPCKIGQNQAKCTDHIKRLNVTFRTRFHA